VQWGARIDWQMEHPLSLKFKNPFFIRDFPLSPQTRFYKAYPNNPELTQSADLIAPDGYGEISGCVQFVDNKREMLERMKEEEVSIRARRWYAGFMRTEVAPLSGFILGVERMLQWICRCEKITEVTAFPREYGRIES
jgi:asparaginyl-tRNA synthetase